MRRISSRIFPQDRRGARVPGGVCRRLDQGRLAGGDDSAGIWRLGARSHRGHGDHGGDQSRRRKLRRLPRTDVQHGHVVAAWVRRAKAAIPAQDRQRRAAPAIDGCDRAFDRHRYDQDQDDRGEKGRSLRRQWAEGMDLQGAAFGSDDPPCAHDGARGCEKEIRGHVDLPGRLARGGRQGTHRAAHPQHGQSRDQRAIPRQSGDPPGKPDRKGRAGVQVHPRWAQRRAHLDRRGMHRRRLLVH